MDLKMILYTIFGCALFIDLIIRILNKINITKVKLSKFIKNLSENKTKNIIGLVFLFVTIMIIICDYIFEPKYKVVEKNVVDGYIEYRLLGDDTYEVSNYIWNEYEKNIVIPSKIKGKKVTSIGESAFDSLKEERRDAEDEVLYPDKDYCLAETIELPSTIKTVKKCAFLDCKKLKKIELPENLEEIGDYAFARCEEKEIKFNSKLVKIGEYAFSKNINLSHVELPDTVIIMNRSVFEGCKNLKEVKLSENILSLGYYIFHDCTALEKIELPKKITAIPEGMFLGCTKLKKVTAHNGIKWIEAYAFKKCKSLSEFDIPNSVEEIGKYTFNECESLREIFIPKNVKKMGIFTIDLAFTKVKCEEESKPDGWDEKCFDGEENSGDNKVLYGQKS